MTHGLTLRRLTFYLSDGTRMHPAACDNSQGAALPDATRGCDKMADSRGQRTTCPEKQSTNPGEFHAIYDLMEGLIGASRAATVGGREARVQSEPPEDYCERLWSMEREATGKQANRGERRHTAWGRRIATLALILVAEMGFAQGWDAAELQQRTQLSPRIASELNRELSRARQGLGGNQNLEVIVQYKQAPKIAALARVQSNGGRMGAKLDLIKGAAFSVPVNALAALENDPEVQFVSVDHPVKGMDDYTNDAMNVSTAWSAGYNGTGIGVAVIDSGINPNHVDWWNMAGTFNRVLYHQDFTGANEYNPSGSLVYDTYGHGTHVAGIIGGTGTMSGGQFAGVARDANLIDLRALDGTGSGKDSQVIAAIQQAIALKKTYNIRVINLSLGRGVFVPYAKDPLCQAVESAWKAGIVVVAAAGNYGRVSVNGSNGYGTISAPGNDPLVLTVGAMKTMNTASRTDDRIASYSSKGPTTYDHVVKPDVVAPGNMVPSLADLTSTLATEYPGNMVPGNSNEVGILLTQVSPICSVWGWWKSIHVI